MTGQNIVLVLFVLFGLVGASIPAEAQAEQTTTLSAGAGIGIRGNGDINSCCGTFQSTRESKRSLFIAAAAVRRVARRVGIGGEVQWSRVPTYSAFVQGAFADRPFLGYKSENDMSSLDVHALIHLPLYQGSAAFVSVLGGLGFGMDKATSVLTSFQFRPTPNPTTQPPLSLVSRITQPSVLLGGDVAFGRNRVSLALQPRVLVRLRERDDPRTDLKLARAEFRLAAGVRISM